MRPRLIIALGLALFAARAFGPAQGVVIRGVVLETGTGLPVTDAEVSFFSQDPGPVLINGGWSNESFGMARTNHIGQFSFSIKKPGPYRVQARKEGYVAGGVNGAPDSAELKLTAEKPAADVKLYLGRPGRLTGSVIDEETRKPVAGLRLWAVVPRNPRDSSLWGFKAEAKTDAEGEFDIPNLPPGEYAVETRPQGELAGRVLTAFSQKDTETVGRDIEHAWWPGGGGREDVLPVSLASGATVHLGQFQVRKVPYYRALVRIPQSSCEPGDTLSIFEYVLSGGGFTMGPPAKAPCGQDVLVTGLAPGNYRLELRIDNRAAENLRTASIPLTVADQNLEITAPLLPPVTVDGVIVAAEGAGFPDTGKIRIWLSTSDLMSDAEPDSEGKFRIPNLRPMECWIFISGLNPQHYVKEIRHNGVPLRGNLVPLDRAATFHTLTIVVDDKPATITGLVVSRDQPVGNPFVVARKWPPASGQFGLGWAGAKGDETGRFHLTGLAPGEYRVIALRSAEPGTPNSAFERALAGGRKIELRPREFLNVTLEVTSLP